MTSRLAHFTLSLLIAGLFGGRAAHAQVLDGGTSEDDSTDGEAGEGLQSATPTDDPDELNFGGGELANDLGGEAGDFPAQNAAAEFNVEGSADAGPDDLFSDGTPTNSASQANGNAPSGALSANPATVAPGETPIAPVANAGASEQVTNAAATTINQVTSPAVSASDVKTATDQLSPQLLSQKPDALPPLSTAPLPPPNEFAGAPPVPGTMRLMADGEAPEEYSVLAGDTLFDICDQLLDEPGYWPKLWALNPEIKNPHFIFPNMKLRFYPGDDETPPYLQVVSEDDMIPIDKGDLDEKQLVAEKVIFPETVVEEYTTEVIGPAEVDALEEEIENGGKRYSSTELTLSVPAFIFKSPKDALGVVIGGRNGEGSVPPGQQVLIESIGGIAAGSRYTVLREAAEVEDPRTGDLVGYRYDFIAEVTVSNGIGDDIYAGRVSSNFLTVRPDDIIVSLVSVARSIPSENELGPAGSVDANIVGFGFAKQDIGGRGSYVFIDKGSGDGVSEGAYLPIFATPGLLTLKLSSSELPEDFQQVGLMRIIDTTDAGACGYILRNTQEIRIGDRTSRN